MDIWGTAEGDGEREGERRREWMDGEAFELCLPLCSVQIPTDTWSIFINSWNWLPRWGACLDVDGGNTIEKGTNCYKSIHGVSPIKPTWTGAWPGRHQPRHHRQLFLLCPLKHVFNLTHSFNHGSLGEIDVGGVRLLLSESHTHTN